MAKKAKPVTAWALVIKGKVDPYYVCTTRYVARRVAETFPERPRIAKVRITEVGRG